MEDFCGGHLGAGGGQEELLVVIGGAAVFDGEVDDDEEDTGFFEVSVGMAVGAEELCASHFEPDGVDGVVDYTGLVGFAVAGDDGYRVGIELLRGAVPELGKEVIIGFHGRISQRVIIGLQS